jgi:CubicO group peptidase (beta-lactamase class C family)
MTAPDRQRVGALIAPLFEPLIAPLDVAEKGRVPGVLVGVLHQGQRYCYAFGQVPLQQGGSAAPEDTVVMIASNTKVFTATLLAIAVLQSRVELDTPVQELLPPGIDIHPYLMDQPVRLRHLATHSAGFPKGLCPPRDDVFGHYSFDATTRFLREFEPQYPPGQQWCYSNQGFALLGALMSHVHHDSPPSEPGWGSSYRDWPQVARRLLLEPLGMASTQVELSPSVRARLAQSYGLRQPGQRYEPIGVGEIDPQSAAIGAGALSSTVPDMLAFLARQIDHGPDVLGRAIALTQSQQEPLGLCMGLGWQVGDGCLAKDGLKLGYASYMIVDPSCRVAVFAFANAEGSDLNGAARAALGALRGCAVQWPRPTPQPKRKPQCPPDGMSAR